MRSGFWSRSSIIIQIGLAILSCLLGLTSFIYFIFGYQYQESLWGFLVAFFSLSVIHLHILFLRNDLDDWYEPDQFDAIKYLAIFFSLISIVSVGVNAYIAYSNKQVLDWSLNTNYVSSILSADCFLWAFVISICTRKYKRYVQMCAPMLPTASQTALAGTSAFM